MNEHVGNTTTNEEVAQRSHRTNELRKNAIAKLFLVRDFLDENPDILEYDLDFTEDQIVEWKTRSAVLDAQNQAIID